MTSHVWTAVIAVLALLVFTCRVQERMFNYALEAKKQEHQQRLLRMVKAMDGVKETLNERENENRNLWKAVGKECRWGKHLERTLKNAEGALIWHSEENRKLQEKNLKLQGRSAKLRWRMFRQRFPEPLPKDDFEPIVQHQKAVKDGHFANAVDELNERKRLMRDLKRAWHFGRPGSNGFFLDGWTRYLQIDRKVREEARVR
jgi:hypothetical protein